MEAKLQSNGHIPKKQGQTWAVKDILFPQLFSALLTHSQHVQILLRGCLCIVAMMTACEVAGECLQNDERAQLYGE